MKLLGFMESDYVGDKDKMRSIYFYVLNFVIIVLVGSLSFDQYLHCLLHKLNTLHLHKLRKKLCGLRVSFLN